jgi:hypothetical protein
MAPSAAFAAALLLATGLGDALSVDKDSSKPTGGVKKSKPKIHAASAVQAVSLQEQGYTAPKETVSGEIEIITVETRSDLVKMPIPGVPGKFFKNLGVNQTWNGLFTKPHLFLEWLSAQRDPEKLVIFADGADVMFGGCTDKELLDAYHRTVAASGNVRVIMGAEMGLDPPPAGAYVDIHSQFEERRRAVQSAEGLQDSSYGSLASCEISRQNPTKCYVPKVSAAKKGRWPCAGPCSNPPAMTFLNSGFIMGPVGEVREVVSGMLRFEDLPADAPFRNNWHDQGAAILYMAENPHKVTLDYNGAIVLNLHQFPISDVMWVKQNSIRNKVLGRASCFIHANGPALGKLNRTLTHMSQMSH